MSITRTLGGDRLGAGKKNFVRMKSYERSTHDLSYIWRSTMAPGTLVPFMSEVGLPGDTFDIDLNCEILTHPTVGPLFGSYKVQLDVFSIPVRLYNAQLHNNKLGIGNNMADILLPQITMYSNDITVEELHANGGPDNKQINPSCIFSYLNIRGLGVGEAGSPGYVTRNFNAIPFLGYWDIYKNYYANKQEEIGAVIHNTENASPETITATDLYDGATVMGAVPQAPLTSGVDTGSGAGWSLVITYGTGTPPNTNQIILTTDLGEWTLYNFFGSIIDDGVSTLTCTGPVSGGVWINWRYTGVGDIDIISPQVYTFALNDIDTMREQILTNAVTGAQFIIDSNSVEPYCLPLKYTGSMGNPDARFSKMSSLEGLGLKTYQSDLFNNWVRTDWIDGVDGISAVTAIDTSGGSFTIDTLNISKKVYDMLNRIAISGGSYKDWIDTVYTESDSWIAETPMYMGGLIKELVFQEVISNAQTADQPLGTIGGRGTMSKKHKGGKITVKVKEPSYIMGIISLTPRLDYSQGNKWDVNLKTMDDFHKPALDEIGFQDLITDQMTWWDTDISNSQIPIFKSAGKQPAWINYMTNVNQVRGNFAIAGNEMFMTLNRKYEMNEIASTIDDLTTYIDPVKFNDIFAETSRDAQNFWTQIGVGITARRIMSAKLIPNL